mgnify:CR=1 FL=1
MRFDPPCKEYTVSGAVGNPSTYSTVSPETIIQYPSSGSIDKRDPSHKPSI